MKALREAPIAVPWLGLLRADWPLVPLRYLVRFVSGGTPDKGNADFWSGGAIPWVSPKDMKVDRISDSEDHITEAALDGSATQLVPVGSVLVVVRGMILAHTLPVAVTTGPVTINQDIKALVCGQRILPEFLHAVFAGQAEWLLSQADSSAHGTKKLETEVLQRFEVPCPPLEVQRRIVATMRAQAKGLDAVVAAKQRVLDLLAEKRKAIIATAVTRGLDPKVKLRDSGVPWLSEIPAHWDVTRLKFIARVQTGIAVGKNYTGPTTEYAYLRVANVQDGFLDLTEVKTMAVPEREAASSALRKGDVLMNEGGDADKLGRGAIWDGSISPCLHQNHVFVLRPESVSSEWLSTWTGIGFARAYFETRAKQSTNLASISSTNLLELPIAVPPDDEQRAIVEHIARETAKLDAVRAATERTIALLKERRAALIAAAVTGQLDVGTAA
jgi:type I restriction enzyme S subunit